MFKKASLFFLSILMVSCATVQRTPASLPPQTIIKPAPSTAATGESKTSYTIHRGDSLWGIAKKNNISVESLRAANPALNPHDLKVGQKIHIPVKTFTSNITFLWPVEGKVINFFGENVDGVNNNGINIAVSSNNTNVRAAAAGTVLFANKLKGWGTTIVLQHYPNTYTVYANLEANVIAEGQQVDKGTNIAKVASGKNGNYVLHFEVREKAAPTNPLKYLN